jgi:hypothetical protein
MKLLLTSSVIMLMAHLSWAQRINNDPTYSIHNYKHPNKAAYARLHNLDRCIPLEKTMVIENDNYKQIFNKPSCVVKFKIKSTPANSNRSYKHPYGL